MMTRLIPAGLVLLFACGGGGDSTGPSLQVDGNWHGSTSTQGFNLFADLTLTDNNGSLTGTGTLTGPASCNGVGIAGSRHGDQVDLTMTCPGYIPIAFSGRVSSSGNSIPGSISGSGFAVTSFDFIKQ